MGRSGSCMAVVEKLFPDSRYEVRRVDDYGDRCLVDFVDREVEPDIDCDDYCDQVAWGDFDYDECVNVCADNADKARISSVEFDPDTLAVRSITAAVPCSFLGEEWESYEGLEREFRNIGCVMSSADFIHPHELVGGAGTVGEIEGEFPAMCYIHVSSGSRSGSGCRLPDVLRKVRECS